MTAVKSTADAAVKTGASNLTFSSTTVFNACGAAPVSKAGKSGSLYTVFKINSAIKSTNIIAAIPDGYKPKVDYKNIPILRIGDNTDVYTVNVLNSGSITAGKDMPIGVYQLGFTYVID